MVSVVSPVSAELDAPVPPMVVPVGAMPERGLRDLLRELPASARRIWPAWAMLLTCAVLGAAMIVMLALLVAREGLVPEVVVFLIWGPLFCASAATGVLILHRYPAHRVGWVLCLAGFTWITANTTYLYGTIAVAYPDMGWPAGPPVLQAGCFYPLGLYLILVELPLIFPTGRLASPRWRVVRWTGALGALGATSMIGFGNPLAMNGEFGDVPNPWHVPGPVGAAMNLAGLGFLVMFAMGIPAGVSMVRRLRRAEGVERAQLRWVALAGAVLVMAYVMHLGGMLLFSSEPWFWVLFAFWGLALNGVGIVTGLAILRYRLFDIDVVIHRAVLYAALVGIIAALYLGLVNLLNAAAQRIGGDQPNPWIASLVVAAGVALVVQPLRLRLEGQVNRRLYGERADPGAVLARLGARLEAAVAPAELLGEVTRTVTDLLRVPHAAVALRGGDALAVVAETGAPGREQVGVPMVYQHEEIGELRVTPRGPGEGFSRADGVVLAEVARQAAVAAYALRVTADLRQARERLVSAREEERRRLRRDLHDGLGAQLAALTMQVNGARRLVRSDPAEAEGELDALQGELRAAIADIRRLVHGLRPPALDEFGLVAALRSRLLAFETASGVAAELRAGGDDRALPAAIEVAVYRIVEEALTNIARHADARRVTVELAIGDEVALEVADDGRGLPQRREPGVGVHSMRERSEELGGSFAIGPAEGGGTRIAVAIPLPEGR